MDYYGRYNSQEGNITFDTHLSLSSINQDNNYHPKKKKEKVDEFIKSYDNRINKTLSEK